MPKYKVIIHYEGALYYTVEADSLDEAEVKACELFDSEDNNRFAECIANSFIVDSWRVE